MTIPTAPQGLPPAAEGLTAPEAPGKPNRPWYKKKRVLIPGSTLLLVGLISAMSDDGKEPTVATEHTVAAPATTTEKKVDQAAEDAADAAEAENAAAEAEKKAADDAAKKAAEDAAAAAAAAAEAAKGTVSQQNAYGSAKSYLSFKGFSRAGLIEQLSSEYGEGFPAADAEFAVARLEAEGGVDWNAEAAESAKSYLEFKSFSRQGLLEQLSSPYGEQFTPEQAEYGVSQTGL